MKGSLKLRCHARDAPQEITVVTPRGWGISCPAIYSLGKVCATIGEREK